MSVVVGFKSDHRGLICYTITFIKPKFTNEGALVFRLIVVFVALALPAGADVPKVVADIAPVHSLVARVMDGVGEPGLLLQPGTSPHSYAMRPSEAAALDDADVVFWVGPPLTPWLERPLATLAEGAKIVALLEQEGTHVLHAEEDAHGDADHDHPESVDPHAWLDPENAGTWVVVIAETLAKADPDNGPVYLANAVAAQNDIADLTDKIASGLADKGDISFAVDHDALGYFEHRFALSHRLAVSSSHAVLPGPARIGALQATARADQVNCVLLSTNEGLGLVETVFEGLPVNPVKVDILGTDLTPGPLLYMDLMHRLGQSLWTC
ncbi:MAG: zinc ABC transporter solute-binding protein [Silicimonas sp.]|nr:zinc ABC transporter solute-binding protein [Silicimonas sp.]